MSIIGWRIEVRSQEGVIGQFEIRSDTTIGRSPDNGLPLSFKTVSSYHAKIERRGGQFVMVDVGSKFGTFLGTLSNRIPEGQAVPFEAGREFIVGECAIRVLSAIEDQADLDQLQTMPEPMAPQAPVQPQPIQPQPIQPQPVQPQPIQPQPTPRAEAAPAPVPAQAPVAEAPVDLESSFGSDTIPEGAINPWLAAEPQLGLIQPRLVFVGEDDARVEPLYEGATQVQIRIGRQAGSEVVINRKSVSKQHALMTYSPLDCVFNVQDRESAQGTTVNGSRIPAEEWVRLDPDMPIRFGPVEAVLRVRRDTESNLVAVPDSDDVLRTLVSQGVLQASQVRSLSKAAAAAGVDPGDEALMSRAVTPMQWYDAARATDKHAEGGGSGGTGKGRGVLVVAIVLVALAAAAFLAHTRGIIELPFLGPQE